MVFELKKGVLSLLKAIPRRHEAVRGRLAHAFEGWLLLFAL